MFYQVDTHVIGVVHAIPDKEYYPARYVYFIAGCHNDIIKEKLAQIVSLCLFAILWLFEAQIADKICFSGYKSYSF